MTEPILEQRALEYARLSNISLDLKTPLGHGTDGSVWKTSRDSAVKSLNLKKLYDTELECYQRLKASAITKIRNCSVPRLLGSSDSLMVIELTIVTPPFILDFAKSYIDKRSDYPEDSRAQWESDGVELFGSDWKEVRLIMAALQRYGIYYYDAKPQNIQLSASQRS